VKSLWASSAAIYLAVPRKNSTRRRSPYYSICNMLEHDLASFSVGVVVPHLSVSFECHRLVRVVVERNNLISRLDNHIIHAFVSARSASRVRKALEKWWRGLKLFLTIAGVLRLEG